MQEHKYAAVMAKFVQALKKGEKPVVYGDGNQTRDWTYVTEAAKGIMQCYEKREKLADSHIVNICSGKEHSVLDLLKILENIIFNGKRTIEPIFVPSRPGDVYRMWGDGTRALSILGFKPTISFRDGLERYVRWYDIEHGE
jgi:UDP-glucose 4-epimerase